MTIFILKILFWWTLASFIATAILWRFSWVSKREPANHLPPLPEGSIDVNRSQRVS